MSLAADIDKLSQQRLSIRKVARILNIARNTVRSYLKESDHCGRKGRYINSYSDYVPTIITKIQEGYNIKQIHYHIVTLGFRGKISTFYDWFKSNIRGYNYYPDKVELADTAVSVHQIPWHGLSPRKLALTTTSTTWGVDKKTGECSKERSLSQKVLRQSPLLQQMQGAYASFRDILHSKQPYLLNDWINTYNNSAIKSVQSFIGE